MDGRSESTMAADATISLTHPFAQHLSRVREHRDVNQHRWWSAADGPMPSLYLSHGAPMLFEMTDWMTELHAWAARLPRPAGIVIVSAHWESVPLSLSATQPNDLVYDFGGFDPMYYRMRYDTPPAVALARTVAALMPDDEPVHNHASRGLDHGAWVPLKIMYPEADIPVLQLSIPTHDPQRLMDLGQRLRPLRHMGILVIGSGYMTHGLPYIDWSKPDMVPRWSADFDQWAAQALENSDIDALSNFRAQAPGMPFAHPTVEHFTPLFVTLGAATNPDTAPTTVIDGYRLGLSRRSLQVA